MKATIQKLCMLSAALSTCAVNAAVYELAHDEVLKIDDGNVAAYADGIKFTGANAVVEFATSSAPRMDWIGGENGGVVRKTNDAEWTMDVKRDKFNGDVEIRAGVVVAAVEQCLGTSWTYDKKVTVFEGATLSMKRVEGLFRAARKLHIRGDGVNGRGAVEFSEKAFALIDQIGYLVLDADATIVNCEPSTGYLYMNALTLNGHRLTNKGFNIYVTNGSLSPGEFVLGADSTLVMTKAASAIDEDPEGAIVMNGSENNKTSLQFKEYCEIPRIDRPVKIGGYGAIAPLYMKSGVYTEYSTNYLAFTQPVTFTNTTGMSQLTVCPGWIKETGADKDPNLCVQLSFLGPITGRGSLKMDTYTLDPCGRLYLGSDANTFSGGAYFNHKHGAETLAGYPGSLGGDGTSYACVTCDYGRIDCELDADGTRWDFASFRKLAEEAVFLNGAFPRLYSLSATQLPVLPVTGDWPSKPWGIAGDVALKAADAGMWTNLEWKTGSLHPRADGTFSLSGLKLYGSGAAEKVLNGTPVRTAIVLDAGTSVAIGEEGLFVGGNDSCSGADAARLVVKDAKLASSLEERLTSSSYSSESALCVGHSLSGYSGALEIFDGAVVSNKIVVGGGVASGSSAHNQGYGFGAVYQHAGDVQAPGGTGGAHLDQGLAVNGGYGGYEMRGGTFVSEGNFSIACYGLAVWTQTGGDSRFKTYGTKTECYFAGGNSGQCVVALRGGRMTVDGRLQCAQGNSSRAQLSIDGPTAECIVNGSYISFNPGKQGGALGPCLLTVSRGGTLAAKQVGQNQIWNEANQIHHLHVGFDGGVFRTLDSGKDIFYSDPKIPGTKAPDDIIVYGGGMTVDTAGRTGNKISVPVTGATGGGVKAVSMATPLTGAGLIASPQIKIIGDGTGAAAVAEYDIETGAVTGIVVTAPGVGYTQATAQVYVSRTSMIAEYTCVLAPNVATGSFTKRGEGDLTLKATNTWGGATCVAGGLLIAGCEKAIPDGTDVVLTGGGTLDLGGYPAKIASVTYGPGGGSLVNASAASLPAASLALSFEDIIAGRKIVLPDGADLTGWTLKVTGEASLLAGEDARGFYAVSAVDGGAVNGTPAISSPTLPTGWVFRVTGRGVRIFKQKGTTVVVR